MRQVYKAAVAPPTPVSGQASTPDVSARQHLKNLGQNGWKLYTSNFIFFKRSISTIEAVGLVSSGIEVWAELWDYDTNDNQVVVKKQGPWSSLDAIQKTQEESGCEPSSTEIQLHVLDLFVR